MVGDREGVCHIAVVNGLTKGKSGAADQALFAAYLMTIVA